jgi:enoyl-CoA hydratase
MYREISATFTEINDRPEIKVAILTGEGSYFCAGRDLRLAETEPREVRSAAARAAYGAIYHCAVPVIGAINGPAVGAGILMAFMTDFMIASTSATFAHSQINSGLNGSIATLLRGLNQFQARYYAFTGETITAEKMCQMGAVQRMVPPDALDSEVQLLATTLAVKNSQALRAAKWSANEVEALFADFEQAYRAIESRVTMSRLDGKVGG